jgi:tetratricopeptide (TPR) repeat protein/tRNA A-37 threonylcarbamoyl transferase component Bud32
MSPFDSVRLQALFAAAVELPLEQREEMLARECADAPDLLVELRELLAADARVLGTTAQPIAHDLASLISPAETDAALSGLRVGAFILREELGRGGMGTVYRAERVDGNVTQQVAIKFVRRERLDANTLKRFQLERQLMATLDHPNIARLLDSAELPDGTPYYVMEYVDGVPITDYCARESLGLRDRVSLMRRVCAAVAEAHHKLIVHRDLKPSNILVGAAGAPKLLDFGIAKPLGAPMDVSRGEQTGTAQRYFSPLYAAPEQLTGAPVGVACDVYALGQLLYEVLAGHRPFDFSNLTHGQIERLILDTPPAAPSAALRRRAGAHGADIRPRQLRGDLDGIVLRCLRKSPNERYASVEQLEADLGRYLDGLPVQARGGHAWYRTQKFVRRHKAVVAAGALVVVSLAAGVVAFASQARIAQQRATELEQVSNFQGLMLSQVDPNQAGQLLGQDFKSKFEQALIKTGVPQAERAQRIAHFGRDWGLVNSTDAARELIERTILRPAADAIDAQFKDQPVVDARLRQVLADRYRALGLYEAEVPLRARILEIRRRVLGDQHADTLTSINDMGDALLAQNKSSEAEPYYREALEKRRRFLGAEHQDTLASLSSTGLLLHRQGRLDESESYLREARERSLRVLGPDSPLTLGSTDNLASLLLDAGKLTEAESYLLAAMAKRRQLQGEEHPETIVAILNMSEAYAMQGKFAEAEPLCREALDKNRRVLGEEHPTTLISVHNLSMLLVNQGRYTDAEPYARDALEKRRRILGSDNPETLISVDGVATVLMYQGRLAEAEPLFREALAARRRVLGEEHPSTLVSINRLAQLLQAQGRFSEAEPYYREALEKSRRVLGSENPDTIDAIQSLGAFFKAQGDPEHAEPYYREALETQQRLFGDAAAGTIVAMSNLSTLLRSEGKLDEADTYSRLVLERTTRAFGDEDPRTLIATRHRAALLAAQGKHGEAVKLLAPAEGRTRAAFARDGLPQVARFLSTLAISRAAIGEFAAAEAGQLEAHGILTRSAGVDAKEVVQCTRAIVDLYSAWHKVEPGKGYDARQVQWKRKLDQLGAAAVKKQKSDGRSAVSATHSTAATGRNPRPS